MLGIWRNESSQRCAQLQSFWDQQYIHCSRDLHPEQNTPGTDQALNVLPPKAARDFRGTPPPETGQRESKFNKWNLISYLHDIWVFWDFYQFNLLFLCLCNKRLFNVFSSAVLQRDRNHLEREDVSVKRKGQNKPTWRKQLINPSLELVCSSVPLSIITQDRAAPICTGLNLRDFFFCVGAEKMLKTKSLKKFSAQFLLSDLCGSLRLLCYSDRSAKHRNHHSKPLNDWNTRTKKKNQIKGLVLVDNDQSSAYIFRFQPRNASTTSQHEPTGARSRSYLKTLWGF